MQHILKCSKYTFTYANVGHLRVNVTKKGYKLHNDRVKCSHTQCVNVGDTYMAVTSTYALTTTEDGDTAST